MDKIELAMKALKEAIEDYDKKVTVLLERYNNVLINMEGDSISRDIIAETINSIKDLTSRPFEKAYTGNHVEDFLQNLKNTLDKMKGYEDFISNFEK